MRDRPADAEGGEEFIQVTPAMIAAGVDELREHALGDDWGCVLEDVYRAMAYAVTPVPLRLRSSYPDAQETDRLG